LSNPLQHSCDKHLPGAWTKGNMVIIQQVVWGYNVSAYVIDSCVSINTGTNQDEWKHHSGQQNMAPAA